MKREKQKITVMQILYIAMNVANKNHESMLLLVGEKFEELQDLPSQKQFPQDSYQLKTEK